jgi:cellulose synthase/poly-beta-1,6-N-acetylglucosamine synthase-like glycosyltransferase
MTAVLLILWAPLALVDLVFLAEVLLGLWPQRHRSASTASVRTAVLIPAHNEAAIVRASVARMRAAIGSDTRLLLVAHNCDDATGEEARAGGAEVVALTNPAERGKGFALAFGRDQLAHAPPDVVVVVDADCEPASGSIQRIAARAVAEQRTIQSCYLFRTRTGDGPMVQVSNFAMLVKNLVRQRGGARIGAAAPLAGSGMAFPWAQFAALDLATGNIVEDLAIGVELTRRGTPPRFEEAALTWSDPSSAAGTETQRARWEVGFLQTARTMTLPLVREGLRRGSWPLIWMGLHVLVAPLTLLLSVNILVAAAYGVLTLLGAPAIPFHWALLLLGSLIVAVLAAWIAAGRHVLSGKVLVRLPAYLLWKLAMYGRLVRGTSQAAWVRTERVD